MPDPKPPARTACPICGKPATPRERPFCSPRCAQIDLGRWFGETYRIPTSTKDDPDSDVTG
ncbi:MAG: DNA gyrase inhibitor YacG [Acetobacteraceae bacterium]|nr:DNA gyrase inhibitor YacG [Acetobacteraceae bacterium]